MVMVQRHHKQPHHHDGAPVEDDDDGGDEGEGGADGLEAQEQPPVAHHLGDPSNPQFFCFLNSLMPLSHLSILTLLESLYERLILRSELGLRGDWVVYLEERDMKVWEREENKIGMVSVR